MRFDVMDDVPPAPKPDNEILRRRLAKDVAAFLAKGNRIKRIPEGIMVGTSKEQAMWRKKATRLKKANGV